VAFRLPSFNFALLVALTAGSAVLGQSPTTLILPSEPPGLLSEEIPPGEAVSGVRRAAAAPFGDQALGIPGQPHPAHIDTTFCEWWPTQEDDHYGWDQARAGFSPSWLSELSLFGGVHGFKTPTDFGRNGNFGFHEGCSFGGALGDPFGLGYQVGIQAVHSNFEGNQTLATSTGVAQFDHSSRNQVFFTAGLFRRALNGGLQGGTVVDYVRDSYFASADLTQIRSETSLVIPGHGELGFWGAYGVGKDHVEARLNPQTVLNYVLGPRDMYAIFYRRYFSGGGQGRVWAGLSGMGDAVLGGEISVPIGTSWALENNFTYLLPKRSAASGGQQDESWAVAIRLVWYPGQAAWSVRQGAYFPLFGVADNSVFLVDHR